MYHFGTGWGGGGYGGFWLLVGLLLLIALVVLIVWAVASISRTSRAATHDPSRPTPNEILRERFARGEITAQEFEDARKVLGPDR
jgi:putative membrane protein